MTKYQSEVECACQAVFNVFSIVLDSMSLVSQVFMRFIYHTHLQVHFPGFEMFSAQISCKSFKVY